MPNAFSNLYLKIPRRARTLIIIFVLVLAIFLLLRFIPIRPKNVPGDFLKARQEASLAAKKIVSISDESSNNIKEVSKLDEERKYSEALNIISRELERNREARGKAIQLSIQLEIMAKNLAQISPASAGQKALEAVSSETALISRLITYNDYLTQLLEVLKVKFLRNGGGDGVPELIQKINNEAQAINDLDKKFNDAMKGFDSE